MLPARGRASMIAIDSVDTFVDALSARLEQGAAEYGNRSLLRPVSETVDEIRQELLDEAGWLYVLWCQAERKLHGPRPEQDQRAEFARELRHRLARNDRGTANDTASIGLRAATHDLMTLAMDVFEHAQHVELRLRTIARVVEVAIAIDPDSRYRARRGSVRKPRSDD